MVLEQKTPDQRRWRRKQLADYWGVSERSIDRMARDGRLGEPKYIGKRTPTWSDAQREQAERSSRDGR
jgi:predicted DNA-binding transcriptional regulator AlpA